MAITEQTVTLEEFLTWPEEKPALEFEDGRVTQKVAPQGEHSFLQTTWPAKINDFAVPRKLALALTELRETFAGASRVPDISVFLWERIPRTADGKIANRFTDPPDIAIEIVSPGQSVVGQIRRCQRFLAEGVRLALIADPDDETVVRLGSDGSILLVHGSERIDLDEILPGFELTAAELFGSLKLD